MALDPVIAGGFRGIELQNPLDAYARVAQLQHLQQQNALAALQAEEYKRGLTEQEGVRNYLASKVTPQNMYAPETQLGLQQFGQTGLKTAQSLATSQKVAADLAKVKVDTAVHQFNLAKSRADQYREELAAAPDRATALSILQRQANDSDLAGTPATQIPLMEQAKRIPDDPAAFNAWKQQQAMGMSKWFEANKQHFIQQRLGNVDQVLAIEGMTGRANVVPGSVAQVGISPADAARIKLEGQRVGLEGRRVAVLERDSLLAKDPVFQQRMAAAKATGEAIAKGEVAARQALPGAIANAEQAVNIIDQMVGKQEVRDKKGNVIQAATAPHPGFENAVGTTWKPGARFVPGTDAANFQALFDQTQGAAFLEAYNTLRGAGAISEKEGVKATAARSRMALAQSETEFVAAAREYQDVIRKGLQVLQQKGGGAASSGATIAPNIDALLEKYK